MQFRSELDSEDDILNTKISINTMKTSKHQRSHINVGVAVSAGFGINIVAAHSEVR